MIVKDKKLSIEKATHICNKFMKILRKELTSFSCEDDPAEYIYLLIQVVSLYYVQLFNLILQYGSIYNIENLDHVNLKEILNKSISEYLSVINKETK